jgi:hypothetical protein
LGNHVIRDELANYVIRDELEVAFAHHFVKMDNPQALGSRCFASVMSIRELNQ